MSRLEYREDISPQEEYLGTLTTVRDAYQEAGLDPLFVGGVIAKAVKLGNLDAIDIDYDTRTVHIPTTTAEYTSPRKDGTYDDFDLIVNHPDKMHVEAAMASVGRRLNQQGFARHFVSAEPVRYPHWKARNQLMQMVSGIDVDEEGQTHFCFGSTVSPPVSERSMQPWNYIMHEDGTEVIRLPSFGPEYFGLRYLMRLPIAGTGGLREKDRVAKIDGDTGRTTNKIHTLMSLRKRAKQLAAQRYVLEDWAWRRFIIDLQHEKHQDALTYTKSKALRFWWGTLGQLSTDMAHGKGAFQQVAKLGNKFGG